jgi:integrase/recombinase XerD
MKLSTAIKQYADFKLALGGKFETTHNQLRRFMKAVGDVQLDELTEEEVQKFLRGQGPMTNNYHCKHTAINGLFKFALARDYCRRSPLPQVVPKRQSNFSPYIYSSDDLQKLLAATGQSSARELIEPDTFRVLILLLYGAMLRISEALSLDLNSVDLDEGLLTVHDSKFHKTRIVPIGSELKVALKKYSQSRHKKLSTGKFFVTREKKEITGELSHIKGSAHMTCP